MLVFILSVNKTDMVVAQGVLYSERTTNTKVLWYY